MTEASDDKVEVRGESLNVMSGCSIARRDAVTLARAPSDWRIDRAESMTASAVD